MPGPTDEQMKLHSDLNLEMCALAEKYHVLAGCFFRPVYDNGDEEWYFKADFTLFADPCKNA